MDTAALRLVHDLVDGALAPLNAALHLVEVNEPAAGELVSQLRAARLNADLALTNVQRRLRNGG